MGNELTKLAKQPPVVNVVDSSELESESKQKPYGGIGVELAFAHLKFLLHASMLSGEPDSTRLLEAVVEDICKTAFGEECEWLGWNSRQDIEFIPAGERAKAGRLLLDFLCDKGYLPQGTTVSTVNQWFLNDGVNYRNNRLHNAILGEGRLAVWLAENPDNRRKFWEAIMPEKPLPGESVSNSSNVTSPDVQGRRKALKNICGKRIANDIGNWDGAREARHWQFTEETTKWLVVSDNVKKLLPPGPGRKGERAVNNHLKASFGFTLGRSTLLKYGFIKTKK